jgi:hypothetical protein
MLKRIIRSTQEKTVLPEHRFMDLESLAEVEITSEDSCHPIESALYPTQSSGWRASEPGTQTLRLIFHHPQRLECIRVDFVETQIERTQEYVLRWSPDGGRSYQEIVRQQWCFSRQGANREIENHHVELPAVTVLELVIIPDISGNDAIATLQQLCLR